MQWMSPALRRALTPTCPHPWSRLAAWLLVATFAMLLLSRGLPVQDTLVVLGAVSSVAVALAAPATRRPGGAAAQSGEVAR